MRITPRNPLKLQRASLSNGEGKIKNSNLVKNKVKLSYGMKRLERFKHKEIIWDYNKA